MHLEDARYVIQLLSFGAVVIVALAVSSRKEVDSAQAVRSEIA
jgi:hypothetical protein